MTAAAEKARQKLNLAQVRGAQRASEEQERRQRIDDMDGEFPSDIQVSSDSEPEDIETTSKAKVSTISLVNWYSAHGTFRR